jgi:hypothetical protein
MPAETPYSICSRALVTIGLNPITNFDGGTTESVVAGEAYEQLVQGRLSGYRWRFAAKQFLLNYISSTAPLDRWQYFLQKPADALVIHGITNGAGSRVEYDIYGDRIACDYNDGLVADYTYRAGEALWPPYFRDAINIDLQAVFTRGIKRDAGVADVLEDKAEKIWWPRARNRDAQQQTARRLPRSNLVRIRG